ncbi:hypothetical protein [Streptomyces erythrochromogenes]|uniref:hypothetical protein n=1 Tax=Streptomyces erythrochromogenes TaxID=285574 RepID=UPI00068B5BED|nr:hypothetical protein [Streptomyces erythrochromogenes]
MAGDSIASVLFTIGRQLAAETIGTDLLVRIAADDGSEQAVRYHWDGHRMTVVNDERRLRKSGPDCDAEGTGAASPPAGGGRKTP